MKITREEAIAFALEQYGPQYNDPKFAALLLKIALLTRNIGEGTCYEVLEVDGPDDLEMLLDELVELELVLHEEDEIIISAEGVKALTVAAEHYNATNGVVKEKKEKKEKVAKAPDIPEAEFQAVVAIADFISREYLTFVKLDQAKTRWSIRLAKNEYKLRAFEIFKNGVFRLYAGGKMSDDIHQFMESIGADIKAGNHYYYDAKCSDALAIKEFFEGKVDAT